jgi:hypothetical protein
MKNLLILTTAFLSLTAFAKVTIVKKDMIVKVALIEADVKCIETDDYFEEASFRCETQGALNKASKSLNGTILKVKALNSISSDVLTNQVDDAGLFRVKFNLTYFN